MANLKDNEILVENLPRYFARTAIHDDFDDFVDPSFLTNFVRIKQSYINKYDWGVAQYIEDDEEFGDIISDIIADITLLDKENKYGNYILVDKNNKVILHNIFHKHCFKQKLCFGKNDDGRIFVKFEDEWERLLTNYQRYDYATNEYLSHSCSPIYPLNKSEMKVVLNRIDKRLKILAWNSFNKHEYDNLSYSIKQNNKELFFDAYYDNYDFIEPLEIFTAAKKDKDMVILLEAISQEKCYLSKYNNHTDLDSFKNPMTNPFEKFVDNFLKDNNINAGL